MARVMQEIFLSASVPLEGRRYFRGANPVLIQAAVRAFAALVLGRRHIVWGGHPSITPLLWAACESLGVRYSKAVTLYQSMYFEDDFPKENKKFRNVHFVPRMPSRDESLALLRKRMIGRPGIRAAVFIGGMEGLEAEFKSFTELHPNCPAVLVAAPGGAARSVALRAKADKAILSETNFLRLLARQLHIDPTEPRAFTSS